MHRFLPPRRVGMTVAALILILTCSPAWAQGTYSVIFNFNSELAQGWGPWSGVVFDHGNIIGTTQNGGRYGSGTVYELFRGPGGTWTYYALHNFGFGDGGEAPTTNLVQDSSHHLYGTGIDQIFELSPAASLAWPFTGLYTFTGGNGGECADICSVSIDAAGNLYGSTPQGGVNGAGVVFTFGPGGYSVLYSFTGGSDGGYGVGALAFDGQGNIYGVAATGGAMGAGVVYRLSPTADPATWTYTVLHDFGGLVDGATPFGGLIMGRDGNLYGTTANGGIHFGGIAFRLTPNSDGTWTESVLYSFNQEGDGFSPLSVPAMDTAGNLYGTTSCGIEPACNGTVYKLTPSAHGEWSETILHAFQGQPDDGSGALGPLATDDEGNLFGTTVSGGAYNNWGTVWEYTP